MASQLEKKTLISIANDLVRELQSRPFDLDYRPSNNQEAFSTNTNGWRIKFGKLGTGQVWLEAWYDRAATMGHPALWIGFRSSSRKSAYKYFGGGAYDLQSLMLVDNDLEGDEPNLIIRSSLSRHRLQHLYAEQYGPHFFLGRYFLKEAKLASARKRLVVRAADFIEEVVKIGINQITDDSFTNPEEKKEIAKIKANKQIKVTEKKALLAARRGQGRFRTLLIDEWRTCAVQNCKHRALLRASHIKPWKDSNNNHRLDPQNGLLLIASLDAAFDRGLISFKSSGALIASSRLSPHDRTILGISSKSRLRIAPSKARRSFLKIHRKLWKFPS